jgi:hypothetical protein
VFAGTADSFSHGAAIHIANGASDITILGGRANYEANAIEIVGTSGTTDGITIVGFGANNPTNGYNVGSGSANAIGIAIQPSTGMTVNNVTITGCNLTKCSSHGLIVGKSSGGGTISGVSAVGNSFWGYSSLAAAVSVLGSGTTNVHVATNPGYNPVGAATAPTIAVGSAIANPFQQAVRVFLVSSTVTGVSITAATGGATSTGITPTADGILVPLGVGEKITLSGTLGTSAWEWFLD